MKTKQIFLNASIFLVCVEFIVELWLLKGEHCIGVELSVGWKIRGNKRVYYFFPLQNIALFKRYQPLKFKIFNFLSSLVVVWTYFFVDIHVTDWLGRLFSVFQEIFESVNEKSWWWESWLVQNYNQSTSKLRPRRTENWKF